MNATKQHLVALSAIAGVTCAVAGCASQQRASGAYTDRDAIGHIEITRAAGRSAQSQAGTSDHFTGAAAVSMLYAPNAHRHASSATVAFEPSARTVWHSHPAGQTLVVTHGSGWVQSWGSAKLQMSEGDVVWIPPNVKHWHGATATERMTHVATQEQLDGEVVEWMEPVTDAQYGGPSSGEQRGRR